MNPMVSKFAEEIDSDTEYDPVVTTISNLEDEKDHRFADMRLPPVGRMGAEAKSKPPQGFDSLFKTAPQSRGAARTEEEGSEDLEDFLGEPDLDIGKANLGAGAGAGSHDGYDSL
jgi:hypothetical protein